MSTITPEEFLKVLRELEDVKAQRDRLAALRETELQHTARMGEWTEAFQPAGPLYGVLPTGADIRIDGGKWLLNVVLRLRKEIGMDSEGPVTRAPGKPINDTSDR
jgi:hypothetical protein